MRVKLNDTLASVDHAFAGLLTDIAAADHPGVVADYIPALADASPKAFGIAATSVSGHTYQAGDANTQFTLQSISKPFVYALVLADIGQPGVMSRVGVEPSGEAFNALSFDASGRPFNPMINAGAIVTTSLLRAGSAAERCERIRHGLSRFAGRALSIDEAVYESETATGDRNRALAGLARASGMLAGTVEEAVTPYFTQCSLLVTVEDLAVMASTLANNGVHPLSGEQILEPCVARDTLSVMASCGMYDRSGEWMLRVGLPAKSGVSGGIVAVRPGMYGIGVFSPPLDEAGNSSRGVAMLQRMSSTFDLHMLAAPPEAASPIETLTVDAAGNAVLKLRGHLDFTAAERTLESISSQHDGQEFLTLTVDFSNATQLTVAAWKLLAEAGRQARDAGLRVRVSDPTRRIRGRTS